jgi:hypothetical protein
VVSGSGHAGTGLGGGPGGAMNITTGSGGNSDTSSAGGLGGDLTFTLGSGGTGTSTAARNGNFLVGSAYQITLGAANDIVVSTTGTRIFFNTNSLTRMHVDHGGGVNIGGVPTGNELGVPGVLLTNNIHYSGLDTSNLPVSLAYVDAFNRTRYGGGAGAQDVWFDTGTQYEFRIAGSTLVMIQNSGGVSIGHTVDPGAGGLSISGNYQLETGGVNYTVIRTVGGVFEVGDIGAIPGLTALEFLFAGTPIFAANPSLTSLVPPALYLNGVLFAQSSGGNFLVGGGLGAGQSLALSGVGSTTSGIFFQFNNSTICGFRFSGATYDSSGAVLDLSANGVQGSGVIFANPASAKQSTFNILSATTVYPCDTQGGTVTVIANLPALSSVPKGLTFYIYDALGTATSSHPIQLSPHGTDSVRGINAAFTVKIGATYAFVGAIVTASATGWDVMLTQ